MDIEKTDKADQLMNRKSLQWKFVTERATKRQSMHKGF